MKNEKSEKNSNNSENTPRGTLQYIRFYKPYGVLSQFTVGSEGEARTKTLGQFGLPKDVYAAGRLDKDSEGLLLLTNDGPFIKKVTSPNMNKEKTYWVQVERIPGLEELKKLSKGVIIKGGYRTLPCKVKIIEPKDIPERNPPVRFRLTVPTCWLEIKIVEGKNRQVRRMTAAIGFPTLRLIRVAIGKLSLEGLNEGEFSKVSKSDVI
ncbi:MAG: 23S rRNA pseudouridine2457 synthase [Thermoproteota archaeon]|jgi:23S rRNA pseudouridine2457 synthase